MLILSFLVALTACTCRIRKRWSEFWGPIRSCTFLSISYCSGRDSSCGWFAHYDPPYLSCSVPHPNYTVKDTKATPPKIVPKIWFDTIPVNLLNFHSIYSTGPCNSSPGDWILKFQFHSDLQPSIMKLGSGHEDTDYSTLEIESFLSAWSPKLTRLLGFLCFSFADCSALTLK